MRTSDLTTVALVLATLRFQHATILFLANRWKNYFSQLLNVHNVSDGRQIEIHTAEPLVSGPSRLEVEIAIAKLKK
jgi:hypothetical protein